MDVTQATDGVTNTSELPTVGFETITPALATEWIKLNDNIRSPNKHHVSTLARDMREGRWQLTGEAICFTTDGQLVNGQHRLLAIIKSNTSITTLVVRGVTQEAVVAMDRGRTRSHGHNLTALGVKHATTVAAIASRYRARKAGIWTVHFGSSARMTTSETVELVLPRKEEFERYAYAAHAQRNFHRTSPAVIGSLYMLAHEVHPELANQYFSALLGGSYEDAVRVGTVSQPANVTQAYQRVVASIGRLKDQETPAPAHQAEAFVIRGWNVLRENIAKGTDIRNTPFSRMTNKAGRWLFPTMDLRPPVPAN